MIGVLAMAVICAPASYAGEDDPVPTVPALPPPVTSAPPVVVPVKPKPKPKPKPASRSRHTTARATSVSHDSDTGRASGGVFAGAGGMAVAPDQNMLVPALLTAGGMLVLVAAGGVAFRRREVAPHGVGR
jgi:hypothetical protein